ASCSRPSMRYVSIIRSSFGSYVVRQPNLGVVAPRIIGELPRLLVSLVSPYASAMGPFVGRVDELAALDAICDAGVRDGVATAVVVGDPGSGKSRLLAEAAARAEPARQFRVVGFEPEANVPLASAADFLRALSNATPQGKRLDALAFGIGPDTAPLEPIRIFEAAHRSLAAVGPALILVDDLQWVDDISLALCHYLVRAADASGEPLALLAAQRPSADVAAFAASLEQVLPPEHFQRVELGPLGDTEALELVRSLAPGIQDDAARTLAADSGGSPFWLEALARAGGAEIDASRLVTARLRGASADAGTLLAVLAIAARPLALADASDLSGWERERTDQVARELESRGIVVESSGVLRLAHDLIRSAAAGEIPDEQRVRIHRRVSDWLVESAGE